VRNIFAKYPKIHAFEPMNKTDTQKSVSFVADGQRRAMVGSKQYLAERHAAVKAQVSEKFAEQFNQAGMIRRIWLRIRMGQEIRKGMRRELDKIAPHDGLYLSKSPVRKSK
jgi:hypothetical protein